MADLDDIKDGKDWGQDQPADTSRFYIKGAAHHDWGMKARMARVFNPKSGRTVMLAFDHGYFQGPTTGLERIALTGHDEAQRLYLGRKLVAIFTLVLFGLLFMPEPFSL